MGFVYSAYRTLARSRESRWASGRFPSDRGLPTRWSGTSAALSRPPGEGRRL